MAPAERPRETPATADPVLTELIGQAAFPPLPGHKVHDSAINSFFVLLDQLEYQGRRLGQGTLGLGCVGWVGGESNRVSGFRSEGERTKRVTEDA